MAFSASGTFPNIEITQSGTETNLAGLAGLPGVTTNGFEYLLSGARLIQTGSLIIDPTENYLRFASDCPYPNLDYRGTLQLGRKTTVSGAIQYTSGTALIFERQSTTEWNSNAEGAIISTVAGSTFLGYGATILTKSPISFGGQQDTARSATITIESLNIYCLELGPSEFARVVLIATTAGSAVNISGLNLGGADSSKILFATDYQSFSGTLANSTIETNFAQSSDLTLSNLRLASNQNAYDFFLNGNTAAADQITYSVNADIGTDRSIFTYSGGAGVLADQQDFKFSIKNEADSPISGAICLVSVKNNGGRFNPAGRGDIDWISLGNQIATTNGSGLATIRVLTGAVKHNQSFRTSQSNSIADDYVVAFGSYLHSIGSRFAIAKGNNGTEVSANILSDTGVVQTNPATVAAYTGYSINTGNNTVTMSDPLLDGARAYDRWKWWKIQAPNFALEYPSAAGLVCVKDGTTLRFNGNVVIDGTRFRSHPTVTKIETTGVVTTPNGGLCDVLIQDANGQRYSPLITINAFPDESKITIIFGGVPIDVALNQNAPYSYRFRGTTPASVTIQVERDGYEKFVQDVPLALSDVSVFALMPALTDADAVNGPTVKFKKQFTGDAAVLAILRAADIDENLRKYVGRAMHFDFEVLACKESWNSIVSETTETTPDLADVNRWRGFATDTGYAIGFLDNGEVV